MYRLAATTQQEKEKMKPYAIVTIACCGLLVATLPLAGCSRCSKPPERPEAALVDTEPAPPAVEQTETETNESKEPLPPATVYTLTDETELNFTGYKVTGSQQGSFLFYEGTVSVNGDDLETAQMEVTIFTEGLFTEDEFLKKILLSELFFNVAVYPEAEFVSTKVVRADDGYTITGNLTLNGVTRTISFPATMSIDDEHWHMETAFRADRQWWDLTYKGFGEHVMRDRVDIEVKAFADAQ